MDQQDYIILKIPTARQKLLPMFPNDTQRGDIKLVFKSKVFNLCKAHLRLESGYFKKICSRNDSIDEIKQNFDSQAFYNILSCFYGASIPMQRTKLEQYYQVIRFLQIECLLSFLRKDILANISEYDLFVVMRIAHKYSDQQIFVICLQQLQKQSFEQLKLHQFQLLHTELSLFKLIIKSHNSHRKQGKPGIPYKDIDQIIKDYCDGKVMGQQGYQALKLQLINQDSLTSSQYKEIFLDQCIKTKNNPSASTIIGDYPPSKSIIVNNNFSTTSGARLETNRLAQSVISGNNFSKNPNMLVSQNQINPTLGYSALNMQYGSTQYGTTQYGNSQYGYQYNPMSQRTLQMQYTFQKKQNEELKIQKKRLQDQLQLLKKMTKQNQVSQKQNQQQLRILKQELRKKINQQIEHKKIIQQMKRNVDRMNQKLRERSQAISQLARQLEQLKKKKPVEQQEEQNNMIVQSQFLPAHLIGEMMSQNISKNSAKPTEMKKQEKKTQEAINYEDMDQDELQQLYLPRIVFDVQPISTPKFNLPKLWFARNTLTLLYRRSTTNPAKGNNSDLRGKNNLLILINTTLGQNIGGFVSVQIGKNDTNYIEDKGAFLFSLTKNRKFNVLKHQAQQAIFLSDQYLICFANDLMIANDCLKQASQCSWPSSYEGAKQAKVGGHVWFAGQKQFKIKDLQVYQMGEQQMQMVLP